MMGEERLGVVENQKMTKKWFFNVPDRYSFTD
jgi:hypothetical protein